MFWPTRPISACWKNQPGFIIKDIYVYKNSAFHLMLDANNFGDYVLVSCSVCDVVKQKGSVYHYSKCQPAYSH